VVDALRRFADSIKRSLPAALFENKRHLSYLNDEGRPFKMIFGVCGFTIRPAWTDHRVIRGSWFLVFEAGFSCSSVNNQEWNTIKTKMDGKDFGYMHFGIRYPRLANPGLTACRPLLGSPHHSCCFHLMFTPPKPRPASLIVCVQRAQNLDGATECTLCTLLESPA
jgi:hypothetical protein